jgi:hypothetical protein
MRPTRSGLMRCLRAAAAGPGLLAGIVALGSTLACDGTIEGNGEDPVAARSEALRLADNPNGPLDWKYWAQLPPLSGATGDPALTNGGAHLFIAMQRGAANGRYWGLATAGPSSGTWGQYDTRSFASSPTAARLPNVGQDVRLIVVGRGSGTLSDDRRIFWSEGKVTQGTPPNFNAPVKVTNFAAIGTTSFNGNFGFPAVTSAPNGDVIMAYVATNTSNQTRVYVQRKPYNGAWTARVSSPAIPGPFTSVDTPALTYGYPFVFQPILGTIVIRTQNGSTSRLFRIFTDGTSYIDSWIELTPLLSGSPAIQSTPAVEWNDALLTHTVYYRSGTSFYQASFFYNYWEGEAKQIVDGSLTSPSFINAPSVNGNVPFEPGEHWVLGRDSTGRLRFAESHPNSWLIP